MFISYVHENGEVVERLADTLRAFGIEVWLDRSQLTPGSRWKDAIRRAISEGAYFMACFSAEYASRMRTYMNEELTLAIDELRRRPTDQSWFIPVLLNDTGVPDRSIGAGERLTDLQHVRLYEDWNRGIQQILSVIQPVSGMVHQLLQQLADSSARARIKAADNLGKIGRSAEQAVPALVELLTDDNETVRAAAADALGSIGIADNRVVLRLLAITGDDGHPDYPTVHANAALAKMGATAVPALIEALGNEDSRVRTAASKTLAEIGAPATPQLTSALDSDSQVIRHSAAAALGIIGKVDQATTASPLPRLVRMLQQGSAVAADALGSIGDPAAVPALVQALSDPNYLCVSAALALGQIADPAAVAPLVDLLRDADKFWVPRGAAAVAMGNMGQAAEQAVPALTEALGYDVHRSGETWDERAREAVVDALRRIHDPSAPSSLEGKGYRYEMWGI